MTVYPTYRPFQRSCRHLRGIVSCLNGTSRTEKLGVRVSIKASTREPGAYFVQFAGPTGEHAIHVDDASYTRLQAHADGFFASTREHLARQSA